MLSCDWGVCWTHTHNVLLYLKVKYDPETDNMNMLLRGCMMKQILSLCTKNNCRIFFECLRGGFDFTKNYENRRDHYLQLECSIVANIWIIHCWFSHNLSVIWRSRVALYKALNMESSFVTHNMWILSMAMNKNEQVKPNVKRPNIEGLIGRKHGNVWLASQPLMSWFHEYKHLATHVH